MTLIPHPSYPSARSYVLKLHRDAVPSEGRLIGRLEHIPSGDTAEFTSGEALVALLQEHAALVAIEAGREAS